MLVDSQAAARSFPWGNAVDAVRDRRSPANAGTHAPQRSGRCRNCRLPSSRSARYCRPGFVSSDPADPNAPTRTVLPAGSDAATGDGADPDRTRSSGDQTRASAIAGTPRSGADKARRPAPLQYRDPDRYEVIAEHGRGGLGRVMRARDKELGRPVAIKEMLHPGLTSELRFFREALITARLEHPGIVPVHEAGRWPDGTPFYAMKLVAGRPLKALIDEATSLDQRLALLPHVIAVCDAIAYAHSRGIIHRDLKPSNVIVGDFGETVVIDWGLAKDIADPDDPSSPAEPSSAPGLTMAGTVLGTPGYMPPEQAAGVADTRSDVYSIGALLGHVLHGHAPEGASGSTSADAPPRVAKIPAPLLAVIAKATAADPAARYETARALGDDLRQYQTGKLVNAHQYSVLQLVQHWAAQNRRLLAVLVAAFLAVTAVLGVGAARVLHEKAEVEAARSDAEAGRQLLILSHARHSLNKDPTRALLWLDRYRANDAVAVRDIAAEAIARGTSRYVLTGHEGHATSIEPAGPDSFYSVGSDAVLRRWDLDGPRVRTTVLSRTMMDDARLAYNASRQRLVHTTADRRIVVRDGDGPERLVHVAATSARALILSPNGRQLLVSTAEGHLSVIDIDNGGAQLVSVSTPKAAAFDFVGDDRLAMLSSDGELRLWDLRNGTDVRRTLSGIRVAEISQAGTAIALHVDDTISVLDRGLSRQRTMTGGASCHDVVLSPGGSVAALGCKGKTLLISVSEGKVLLDLPQPLSVRVMRFSGNDAWFAYANIDGTVGLVSMIRGTRRLLRGHSAAIFTALEFNDDTLVSGDDAGELRVWPLSSSPLPASTATPDGDLRRVTVAPEVGLMATDSARGIVRLWDEHGGLVHEYRGHSGVIPSVAFVRGGRFIVSAGWDKMVGLWSTERDFAGGVMAGHQAEVTAVVEFQDGAVSLGADGAVLLWDLDARTQRQLFKAPADTYLLQARGAFVAVASHHGQVLQYDARSGAVSQIAAHTRPASTLRYSLDGRWIVSGGDDGVVYVKATDGATMWTLRGAPVITAAISYDSSLLAVATEDRYVRIYALRDGTKLSGHLAYVRRMSFSPRGRILAAACHDSMVRLWDLDAGTSMAMSTGDDPPLGVAVAPDLEHVAVSTAQSFTFAPLSGLGTVGADAISRLVGTRIASFQRPRAPNPEEEMLSYAEVEEVEAKADNLPPFRGVVP
jgi:WD40 repeat protein